MNQKDKKKNYLKWVLIACAILAFVLGVLWLRSRAAIVGVTLTIANSAPDTPSIAYEYVASDYHTDPPANTNKVSNTTYPTNVGMAITFKATASDANGDQWKLAVCKDGTGATVGAGPGYVPSCTGGNWCVSSAFVNDDAENTCGYTPVDGDSESNNWHAYACDATGCSASTTTGTKSDGSESPFAVNHRPTFTGVLGSRSINPLGILNYTTTSDDADTGDQIKLYVCIAGSFTDNADYVQCNDAVVRGTGSFFDSNASADVASVAMADPGALVDNGVGVQDGDYPSYLYIVDNHGFPAIGSFQGANNAVTVNNVAPDLGDGSSIGLFDTDEAGDLTLTAPSSVTPGFKIKFLASDANGCKNLSGDNEISSVNYTVYRTGVVSAENCSINGNDCYPLTATCSQTGANTCVDYADTDASWECSFSLESFADPTVAGSTYSAQIWKTAVKLTDDDNAKSNGNALKVMSGAGTEMGQFMAYDIPEGAIAYGNPTPGVVSSQQTTTLTSQGNTGLDQNVSGTNMCTDFPTCAGNTIDKNRQKYSLSTGFDWETAGTVLTGTPTQDASHCAKPTSSADTTKPTYWKTKIPNPQAPGSYVGQNTLVGVVSPFANW